MPPFPTTDEDDSARTDLIEVFDFVWARFTTRMDGLGDAEWAWTPTADARLGLRWRLAHIAEFLGAERNAVWLGLSTSAPFGGTAGTAGADWADVTDVADVAGLASRAALFALENSFSAWRALITAPALELSAPIGEVGGTFAASTRRSFVLHIADELIHHAAEAALLRDLYREAGR